MPKSFMTASLLGGTRQRRRRFCAPSVGRDKEGDTYVASRLTIETGAGFPIGPNVVRLDASSQEIHPRRSPCPPRRPRRNSLVSLHESLRQAGLPARRGSARPQGVDRASARRTCSSLRASCQSSVIQGVTAGQFCGLELRPSPRFSTTTSAELSAFCRTKCQVGSGAVWDDASAFLATMPPFGEGLHGCQRGFGPCCRRRVFRPAGFHRRTGTSSITPATKLRTNPDSRFGPATADRGSRRIRDQPRNPPKSTEKRIRINSPFSTPPFCVRRCFPWLPVCDDLSCRSNTASIPMPS